ncbi:MAG: NAD(P)-dependent oxidoreductase [Haliangium ochraceum]
MILAAVLGSDVSKSRSPAIHHAAYKALGIEGRFEALSVDAAHFDATVTDLGARGYRYVNVTIPHKAAAAARATTRSAMVRNCGASNTLIFEPDRPEAIHAANTDGYGLLAALADLGAAAGGQDAVVVGAGGAAAGAVEALTAAGARVRVVARRVEAAQSIVDHIPVQRRALARAFAWGDGGLGRALDGARILVSSVPTAAWADPDAAAQLTAIERDTAVLEMAYGGAQGNPLARAVRGRVARYADGLGMLVHQAARAIELALGESPPLGPLFTAARTANL